MKGIWIISLILLFIGCKKANTDQVPPASTPVDIRSYNFDWLIGDWKRSNEEQGKETFESWIKRDSTSYIGAGHTLQKGDTIWQENILLSLSDQQWKFAVTGLNDSTATVFILTDVLDKKFSCINEENDFPNQIDYQLVGNRIEAAIKGDGVSIPFNFDPL